MGRRCKYLWCHNFADRQTCRTGALRTDIVARRIKVDTKAWPKNLQCFLGGGGVGGLQPCYKTCVPQVKTMKNRVFPSMTGTGLFWSRCKHFWSRYRDWSWRLRSAGLEDRVQLPLRYLNYIIYLLIFKLI